MKTLFTKMLLIAGLAASAALAQESPAKKGHDAGVGVRVAFDYDMMYGFEEPDDDFTDDPTGFGFEAGLTARVEMVNNLYFVPEVDFNYSSTNHSAGRNERTYSSMNLEIPLMFRGVVAERFYVNAGAQLNLRLASNVDAPTYHTDPITHKEVKEEMDDFEQGAFSFGIVAGGGVFVMDQVSIDLRFYMGMSELFPDADYIGGGFSNMDEIKHPSSIDMAGAKMMSIKLGVNIWFI